MRVLSSLKARPLGASQAASRALTCSASLTGVTQGDQVVGVPDHTGEPGAVSPACVPVCGTGPRRPAPSRAGQRSAATGLITPPCGVPSSVGANRPRRSHPPSATARSVPWRGTCRAGREDGHDRSGRTPPPGRRRAPTAAWAVGPLPRGVDRLDRVVAATAGPESVGPRLEPCLPLRFQRIDRRPPATPVGDHRNPERTLLSVGLRDEHPPDGPGRPRRRPVLHPVGQLGLRLSASTRSCRRCPPSCGQR